MKQITDVELPEGAILSAADEPGHGGAHHCYQLAMPRGEMFNCKTIDFQNGPVKEHGVNGWTEAMLLAIVLDRLRAFNSGPYACRENAIAITKLEEAIMWQESRTRKRKSQGVEGTSAVESPAQAEKMADSLGALGATHVHTITGGDGEQAKALDDKVNEILSDRSK